MPIQPIRVTIPMMESAGVLGSSWFAQRPRVTIEKGSACDPSPATTWQIGVSPRRTATRSPHAAAPVDGSRISISAPGRTAGRRLKPANRNRRRPVVAGSFRIRDALPAGTVIIRSPRSWNATGPTLASTSGRFRMRSCRGRWVGPKKSRIDQDRNRMSPDARKPYIRRDRHS